MIKKKKIHSVPLIDSNNTDFENKILLSFFIFTRPVKTNSCCKQLQPACLNAFGTLKEFKHTRCKILNIFSPSIFIRRNNIILLLFCFCICFFLCITTVNLTIRHLTTSSIKHIHLLSCVVRFKSLSSVLC